MTAKQVSFPAAYAATLACAGLIGQAAQAAGPGTPADPDPLPPLAAQPAPHTAPVPDWAGFYGGLTLGHALPGKDEVGVSPNGSPASIAVGKLDNEGLNAGLRLGYRWQVGNLVIGPEVALEGGEIGDSLSEGGYDAETKLTRALSLRLKAGVAQPAWGTQIYGILGVSEGDFDYAVTGDGAAGPAAVDTEFSATGHVIGFGIEKQLGERLSVTGEYEHANFGKTRLEDGAGASTQATPRFHNVKLGVNMRF